MPVPDEPDEPTVVVALHASDVETGTAVIAWLSSATLATMLVFSSAAAQKLVVGHEIPERIWAPSISALLHDPPAAFDELQTLPLQSAIPHVVVPAGHETPDKITDPRCVADDHDVFVAGVVVVNTFPPSSTATHNVADAHEIEVSACAPSML